MFIMIKRILIYVMVISLPLFLFITIIDPFGLLWLAPLKGLETSSIMPRSNEVNITPPYLLEDNDMELFAHYVDSLWSGRDLELPLPPEIEQRLALPAQALYLSVRSEGRRLAEFWSVEGTTAEALASLVAQATNALSSEQLASVDLLELSLCHTFVHHHLDDPASRSVLLSNIHRGVRGMEIIYRNKVVERYAPTYLVASNRSFVRLVELFREKYQLSEKVFNRNAQLFSFQAEQVLVFLEDRPRAILMERGNRYIPPEAVTPHNLKQFLDLSGKWLANNIHDDGRMTYKYWPASASESTANNMIRQWMATTALIRFGRAEMNPEILHLAEKNIQYNLDNFYREENGFGLIEYGNQVKLGAVALAALAILEHPERERWQKEEEALQRTIEHLWNEDGSLTSFYLPAGDMRFQNFYPGEALLYWAFLYEREPDPKLLDRFMKSFKYYRQWHLNPQNRNPAFIPWHTQAYYLIWQQTGNPELADFILEMNDWLLPVQEWSETPLYRDTSGRFYDPGRPFGPPHSSSTGVYLEGLIDAYSLAIEMGDSTGAENYRQAIIRGLRSVMQLQFADEVDMFYISPAMRSYVEGGIRTTVYDNEIRCDNVQHNVMAALKIVNVFEENDYLPAD